MGSLTMKQKSQGLGRIKGRSRTRDRTYPARRQGSGISKAMCGIPTGFLESSEDKRPSLPPNMEAIRPSIAATRSAQAMSATGGTETLYYALKISLAAITHMVQPITVSRTLQDAGWEKNDRRSLAP